MNEDFLISIDDVSDAFIRLGRISYELSVGLVTLMDLFYREVATPKEWYLLKYAKKFRTRKKYRRMLILRLRKMIEIGNQNKEDL